MPRLKQTFVFPLSICRQHHGTGVSSPATVVTSGGSPEGVVSQPSDQSGVERAVQEITARSPVGEGRGELVPQYYVSPGTVV